MHEALTMPLWSVTPFILMLLAIAVLPLATPHLWESNRNKFILALILGAPVGAYFAYADLARLGHTAHEYIAFVILLAALYIVSGGIVLRGDLRATPLVNTTFLLVGCLLASIMGTTGAAMVLLRPLLKTNGPRRNKVHTFIFFTFLVGNTGGLLTPLGDPPLFMGYLRGVPFSWTFHLLPEWLFTCGVLLAIYYVWDRIAYWRESPVALAKDDGSVEPLKLTGLVNLPLLAGVVATVAFVSVSPWRELIMVALAAISLKVTRAEDHKANQFNFNAILEVAALFFGIFLTMIPALVLLETRGSELGVTKPWQFFLASGSLSSFLDNTPTYVVFFELAKVMTASAAAGTVVVAGVAEPLLRAISLGSVFMGANTYIGNAPNFMIKVICTEQGIKMPSFFGYMVYSTAILIPVFLLMMWIFLV